MVLYAAAGLQNRQIAASLDTSPQIGSKWRKRFFERCDYMIFTFDHRKASKTPSHAHATLQMCLKTVERRSESLVDLNRKCRSD